jgi:uncharacterized OB-fold protein
MKCKACGKYLFDSETHCADCGEAVQKEKAALLWRTFFTTAAVGLLVWLIKTKH